MRKSTIFFVVAVAAVALLFGALLLSHANERDDAPDFHTVAYVGSDACMDCHRGRHLSWYGTFHRTMTQEASAESVVGVFDGRALDYEGVRTRPVRENGAWYFEYSDPENGELFYRAEVVRTVGSRRYQQYVARDPEVSSNHHRLHWLWHIGERRWVHLNAAFLGPDGQGFDAHVTVWDQNCIFCHNTGPRPNVQNLEAIRERARRGEVVNATVETEYASEVAELGIACESCHGPAAEHVVRNASFPRRLAFQMAGWADPSIVNPARLTPEGSAAICGQCHAQRLPASPELLDRWLHDGPTFRPGDDLHAHVDPVWPETKVPGREGDDLFSMRFWPDRTPRLSAYEYHGLLLSEAHVDAGLTCIDCHTMHDGDPRGMLPEKARGAAACADCHGDIVADVHAHTRHAPDSEASNCYSCHMPRIAYGVMAIHRSHRIEVPAPAAHAAADRPNACNQCHLERSADWAEAQIGTWRGDVGDAVGQGEAAEIVRALHAGDPARRAVAAEAAGAHAAARGHAGNRMLVPHLLLALEDPYPSTRRFALRSMRAMMVSGALPRAFDDAIDRFDWLYAADDAVNHGALNGLWEAWQGLDKLLWPTPHAGLWLDAGYLPDMQRVQALMQSSPKRMARIHIGE